MNRIIVSRHGESVESAERVENGDPRTDKGLTEEGKKQARKLGRDISEEPIDLCVVSEFPRTQETARIALERREVPWVVDGDLNDLRYGELEGVGKERYRAWARDHSLATPLPGGESRVHVAGRLCTAMEALLARPEQCALVVTHELLIADLMHAVSRQSPVQPHAEIPYAAPYRLSADEVSRAAEFLRGWLAQNTADTS